MESAEGRLAVARDILANVRPYGWVAVVLSTVIAAIGLYRDEGPSGKQLPLLSDVIGWLPWWLWLIFALAVLVIVIFEGTYREVNRRQTKITNLTILLDHRLSDQLAALSDFHRRGKEIEDSIRTLQIDSVAGFQGMAEQWANEVSTYLADNLPEYQQRFWSESLGREIRQPNVPIQAATWGNYVERRREQLLVFIKELTEQQNWYRILTNERSTPDAASSQPQSAP